MISRLKKRPIAILLFLSLVGTGILQTSIATAQSPAEIRNVNFTLQHDSLIITYDLLKAGHDEKFIITVEVSTAAGKLIHPQTLTGDVGNNVSGGKGKQIIWDIRKDKVFINEGISVEVFAEPMQIPVRFVHRGTAALLSAVVPGLGITKLNRGGPYWIMAIGFYGAAAGSYLYYSSAENNYQKYLDSRSEDERNSLHSTVTTQNTVSEVMMYTAAAVWVGSMVWTLVAPNKTKPGNKGLSVGAVYDPNIQKPLLTLKYRF
ncbi:MAG: hypothetical protein NTY96_05365 [Bacteroidetes bacterium]|nr:hypothetical protein [Bacteroidota bacterium]